MKTNYEDPPIGRCFEQGDKCLVCDGLLVGSRTQRAHASGREAVNGICVGCGQTYIWMPMDGGTRGDV